MGVRDIPIEQFVDTADVERRNLMDAAVADPEGLTVRRSDHRPGIGRVFGQFVQ